MIKNTAGQKIGAQMVSAADGGAFTDAVTVAVTVDAGTQATGTVGSGACAHEGNGYHTYAPSQAETNGDLIAFTFTGTGAIPATVQAYTIAGDAFTRLGAPAGASVSADVAAVKVDTAAILIDTAEIGAAGAGLTNINLPNQTMDIIGNITGNLSGSVGSVTGAVGSVTGAVGSVTAGVTLANDAITAAKFDESTAFPLVQADTGSSAVARVGADSDTLETLSDQLDAKASQTSVDDLPTNAELATALGTADDAVLAQVALVKSDTAAILIDTAEIGAAGAGLTAVPWNADWDAQVQSEVADALEETVADSIPADGTRPSVKQAIYMLTQFMVERAVTSTTVTVKKPDGSTTLFTLTLDDASSPTSVTRAT